MRRIALLLIILNLSLTLTAQVDDNRSVIIGSYTAKPNAVLALNPPDKNQGFLLPQLTTQQRLSIQASSPSDDGLIVYDLTAKSFFFWKDNGWVMGLGNEALNQNLTFDAATQTLALSNSNSISLAALKEIPTTLGNTGKFLATNGNSLYWEEASAIGDKQNLSLVSNQLSIERGNSTNLNSLTVGGSVISGTLANLTIIDGSVSPSKISGGGNNKVLTTNNVGAVTWSDRNTFSDNQGLSLAGNTLTIERGSAVNLNGLSVGGAQISGSLNNLSIVDGSIGAADLALNSVSTSHLASGGISKVLSTNALGQVVWQDQGLLAGLDNSLSNELITSATLTGNQINIVEAGVTSSVNLNNVSLSGDVSGTINSNKVTKIQSNPVNATTLGAADAGKMLVWDGSQWSAASSTTVTDYYAMDPSQFTTMRPDGSSDRVNAAIFITDNTFLTAHKDGQAEDNIGGLNLPHGATIAEITIYYMDKDAPRNMQVSVTRKSFSGANEALFTWTSNANVDAISSVSITSFNGREVIDNNTYSYRVFVSFDTGADTWATAATALQRFYGLRVRYTR